MINAAVMNAINIAGNAVFIYAFRWGAFGAGLATTLSRMVSVAVILYILRNPKRDRKAEGGKIKQLFDRREYETKDDF
jgi:Na+-driven multidrug efflux pump